MLLPPLTCEQKIKFGFDQLMSFEFVLFEQNSGSPKTKRAQPSPWTGVWFRRSCSGSAPSRSGSGAWERSGRRGCSRRHSPAPCPSPGPRRHPGSSSSAGTPTAAGTAQVKFRLCSKPLKQQIDQSFINDPSIRFWTRTTADPIEKLKIINYGNKVSYTTNADRLAVKG